MTKGERTKSFIIQKVAPIFNKKGVYGTSLSDLTSATQLTKGAIYGNFRSKDALAVACFEYNLQFLQKGLYKSLAVNGSATQKLHTLIDFYTEHYQQIVANGGCPLMNSAIEADDAYPLLKNRAQRTLRLWNKEISGIVVESQKNGDASKSVEPNTFSNTFIAMIEGGLLVAKTLETPSYFKQTASVLKAFVENELRQTSL